MSAHTPRLREFRFGLMAAMLPILSVSPLHGEIKGEELGVGFVRTQEEESGPAVRGFVERDGKIYGKIDAFTFSTFLVAGRQCSFVPTDAILHIPETMKKHLTTEKSGRMVLWPKFYRSNRAYFHTVEVSPEEFTGKREISEARMKQWQSLGRVVVAVYHGNPISVPKPKTEPVVAVR